MASYRDDRVSDSDSDHTAEYNTEEEELQPGPSKKSKSAKAKRVPGAASYGPSSIRLGQRIGLLYRQYQGMRTVFTALSAEKIFLVNLPQNCTRNNLSRPEIQNFPGGACPQTPLAAHEPIAFCFNVTHAKFANLAGM